MFEYKCKSDDEVYCILSVNDYDLAKQLIGKHIDFNNDIINAAPM